MLPGIIQSFTRISNGSFLFLGAHHQELLAAPSLWHFASIGKETILGWKPVLKKAGLKKRYWNCTFCSLLCASSERTSFGNLPAQTCIAITMTIISWACLPSGSIKEHSFAIQRFFFSSESVDRCSITNVGLPFLFFYAYLSNFASFDEAVWWLNREATWIHKENCGKESVMHNL